MLDYTSFLAKIISKSICESDSFSVLSNSLQTPWTLAHQAPLSMEFSRQECSSIHPLLQSISATQGSNPCLLHCRQILYCLSHCIYIYIYPSMLVSLRNSSSELPESLSPGQQYSVKFQNKSDAHSFQMHTVNFLFQSTKLCLGRGIFFYPTSPLVSSSLQDLNLFLIF